MKRNSSSQKLSCTELLLFICIVVNTSCESKQKNRDSNGSLVGYAKLDSQRRAENSQMQTEAMFENCSENTVKKKFLEYMDSYYPDWKIKGEIKVFKDTDKSDPSLASMFGLCAYNIRFRAINPHIKDSNIIVVKFQYNSTNYDSFSINTVRGVLY